MLQIRRQAAVLFFIDGAVPGEFRLQPHLHSRTARQMHLLSKTPTCGNTYIQLLTAFCLPKNRNLNSKKKGKGLTVLILH